MREFACEASLSFFFLWDFEIVLCFLSRGQIKLADFGLARCYNSSDKE